MILPDKHTRVSTSLLGLGALVLRELRTPHSPSALWERLRGREEVGNFQRMVAALDLLYLMGAVNLEDGLIRRTNP